MNERKSGASSNFSIAGPTLDHLSLLSSLLAGMYWGRESFRGENKMASAEFNINVGVMPNFQQRGCMSTMSQLDLSFVGRM